MHLPHVLLWQDFFSWDGNVSDTLRIPNDVSVCSRSDSTNLLIAASLLATPLCFWGAKAIHLCRQKMKEKDNQGETEFRTLGATKSYDYLS